jgi:hypothetical protein
LVFAAIAILGAKYRSGDAAERRGRETPPYNCGYDSRYRAALRNARGGGRNLGNAKSAENAEADISAHSALFALQSLDGLEPDVFVGLV